ncbi:MAG: PAS domain S-box protein [Anaerolineales bacterium]|nr:PAS domain S-box protein [Anaerolineales bacterium]
MQSVVTEHGIVHCFTPFLEDITNLGQSAITLQAERDLVLSEMNTMGQGLTVIDKDSNFVFINSTYAQLTGYGLEELLKKSPKDITHPQDFEALMRANAERKLGLTTTYETRLVRADGTLINVLITGTPRWRDGKIDGSIAAIIDLTKYKQMERELLGI